MINSDGEIIIREIDGRLLLADIAAGVGLIVWLQSKEWIIDRKWLLAMSVTAYLLGKL